MKNTSSQPDRQPRLPDPIPDFSKREKFPGLDGNPFDIFLHGLEGLDKVPGILFLAVLALLAFIPTYPNWIKTTVVLIFMLSDWIQLLLLPKLNKSYGPARPPVLLLAICRSLVGLLPLYTGLVLQAAASALVFYSTWVEPHKIHVTYQNIFTPRLPNDLGLRILHLGDLHLEHPTRREEQLQTEIERLKPDLILFSGDFLNLSFLRNEQSHRELCHLIQNWNAPLGVYAVTGSPAVDLPEVIPSILDGINLIFLRNQKVTLHKNGCEFDLAGVSCTHRPHFDGQILSKLVQADTGKFTILLYHSPDLASTGCQPGYRPAVERAYSRRPNPSADTGCRDHRISFWQGLSGRPLPDSKPNVVYYPWDRHGRRWRPKGAFLVPT